MAVEIQVAAEGVRDHDDHEPDAIFLPSPLLQHLRTQDRQIVQEMPVSLKQRPEHIRHGEGNVSVRDVGELPPLISLPGSGRLTPTTGTSARFTRVIDDPFFAFRGKDLRAEGRGAARENLPERLPHVGTGVVAIPYLPMRLQDLFERSRADGSHRGFFSSSSS